MKDDPLPVGPTFSRGEASVVPVGRAEANVLDYTYMTKKNMRLDFVAVIIRVTRTNGIIELYNGLCRGMGCT